MMATSTRPQYRQILDRDRRRSSERLLTQLLYDSKRH
jgi:hypothetical protein